MSDTHKIQDRPMTYHDDDDSDFNFGVNTMHLDEVTDRKKYLELQNNYTEQDKQSLSPSNFTTVDVPGTDRAQQEIYNKYNGLYENNAYGHLNMRGRR